jgi:soluble lytic murein transglycosylase-like protein
MRVVLLAILCSGASVANQFPPGEVIERHAVLHQVPIELICAVIEVESAWQTRAVSPKGAVGLMQLMPATAVTFAVANRFVPEQNVAGGSAYLGRLIRRFNGDLRLVVAAYFAGEERISRHGLRCANPEVHGYVLKVATAYRKCLRMKEVNPHGELETADAGVPSDASGDGPGN